MKQVFQPEWRTQNRRKRRFYAKYMKWLEVAGYLVVATVVSLFVLAFNYKVDDVVDAADVTLTPLTTEYVAESNGIVVAQLAAPGADVRAGDPVLEIVSGDSNVSAYQRWAAIESLKNDPSAAALVARNVKPVTTVIRSPGAGTVQIDFAATNFQAKTKLFSVLDYRQIECSADLSGPTVANARVGQAAKISRLTIGGSSAIFRSTTPRGPVLSSELISENALTELNRLVAGQPLTLRDNGPLKVDGVSSIEVDSRSEVSDAAGQEPGISLEPPTNYSLNIDIVEGSLGANAQIADLPASVRDSVAGVIAKDVVGKSLTDVQGNKLSLANTRDMNIVMKVKASPASAPATGQNIDGTTLKQVFHAKLRLSNPPEFLVKLLKSARQSGKEVKARVEVKTGARPFAFILLKKS